MTVMEKQLLLLASFSRRYLRRMVNHLLDPFRDGNMRKITKSEYPFSGSECVAESNIDALFPAVQKVGAAKTVLRFMSEDTSK